MTKQILMLLALATLIGAVLRLEQLGQVPAILNRDEAALAYNGYLLQATGQDEWARSWPLALESFGDFKLPGYPVLLAGLFTFLPLTDWVVKLPSVIAGITLIPLIYALARKLHWSARASLLAAWLVALNPVFLFYSRIAFEANVALSLLVAALVLLLAASPTKMKDGLALLLLGLAIFTYNTPLLLLPFLIPAVVVTRGWKPVQSWLLPMIGLAVLFIVGMGVLLPLTSQKSGITIFTDESTWRAWIAHRESLPTYWQSTLGSRYVYWLSLMWTNFWQSFSPQFLVTQGGMHPWHSIPNWGHLYWSTYWLAGVGLLIAGKEILFWKLKVLKTKALTDLPAQLTLIYLLVISLIPSVITVDAPHTTRSLFFLVLVTLAAATGFERLVKLTEQRLAQRLLMAALTIVLFWESSWYLSAYFIDFAKHQPASLKPGFDQVIQLVEAKYPQAQVAVVDDQGFHYILTAWYLKLPAEQYLAQNVRQLPDKIGFRYGEQLTHYHFIAHESDRDQAETVLVNWAGEQWEIKEY